MRNCGLALGWCLAVGLAFAAVGHAQTGSYRTPWGDPDLQGIWNNQTPTPLERPEALAGKTFLTPAEATEVERTAYRRLLDFLGPKTVQIHGDLDAVWLQSGKVVPTRRTALIVDPPDGKIPYTAEGKKRWGAAPMVGRAISEQLTANGPEDRTLTERCIADGEPPHLPNPFNNNNRRIFQTPGYVALLSEDNNFRIVPLDGRPHQNIPQWNGTSHGRWQNQTLIVETDNFNERRQFFGTTAALRLVERFTRVDANTINYQVTVTDPSAFTQSWIAENALRKTQGLMYEYACHEGNYALVGMLAGARAEESRKR